MEPGFERTSASDENRGYGVVNWGSLITIVGGYNRRQIFANQRFSYNTHRRAHDRALNDTVILDKLGCSRVNIQSGTNRHPPRSPAGLAEFIIVHICVKRFIES